MDMPNDHILLSTGIALLLACGLTFWITRSLGTLQASAGAKPAALKSLTFRVSNIPRHVTKDAFKKILDKLSDAGDTKSKYSLVGYSYSLAAGDGLIERYWVATASLMPPPSPSQLEKALKRGLDSSASRLRVDVDFLGITTLSDASQEPAVE